MIRDPAHSWNSYIPPENRLAALDALAFDTFHPASVGQISVGSRTEHDQAKTITATIAITRFGMADDAPRQHSGDLHNTELLAGTIIDGERVLFIATRGFFFVRSHK